MVSTWVSQMLITQADDVITSQLQLIGKGLNVLILKQ